jgi:sortase A
MRVARVVGGVGRALITGGVLLLLFVAYQLWGTGIREAQAQTDLQSEFERTLETTTTTTAPGEDPAPPPPPVPTPEGDAVAMIRIPRIGVEKAVVEGVSIADLRKGPGRYPTSPMPGQLGNAAIAGHRTTYGAPFLELDQLEPGDEILVRTRDGEFRYLVNETRIVQPHQVEVLDPTENATLTLTTCHPRYSARQRLIVTATLDGEGVEPPPAAPAPEPPVEELAQPQSGQVMGGAEATLDGDREALVPAALWALACAGIWAAAWALGRRWHRLPAYALGLPVFAVALFLCFEQVARLFPASI